METEKPWPRRVSRLLVVAVAGALAGLLASAPAASAVIAGGPLVRGSTSAGVAHMQGRNTAWSGWIDVADANVAFRSVAATFTVPAVTCTARGAQVALWVGLDGYPHGNPTIEQIGVAADCVQTVVNGIYPTYFAWYQLGLDGQVIRRPLSPGDIVSASVRFDSRARRYRLALTDSRRASADIRVSLPCPASSRCHNSSAEVIAEDPDGGYSDGSPLADFGVADFSDVTVTSGTAATGGAATTGRAATPGGAASPGGAATTSGTGTTGSLAGNARWHTEGEAMIDTSDNVVAEPSAPSDGCTAFSVTYMPGLVLGELRTATIAPRRHRPAHRSAGRSGEVWSDLGKYDMPLNLCLVTSLSYALQFS
jgi:Peptidase A4 family